jgi:predicted negative regulator of RcsB-dependent stress response
MSSVTIPSDAILLAMIASFTTLGAQLLGFVFRSLDRKKDNARREALAEKVESTAIAVAEKVEAHSTVIAEKLDANTEITKAASLTASAAFVEANDFNQRLLRIENELKTTIESELGRLSRNMHAIANALTPVIGQLILENRKEEGREKSG